MGSYFFTQRIRAGLMFTMEEGVLLLRSWPIGICRGLIVAVAFVNDAYDD